MKIEEAGTVMVQRGTYYLGRNCLDKDGNIAESNPPEWKPDPEGSSVIVTLFNPEKNEQIGKAELFSWWDSCGIEQCVRDKLELTRRNFPSPEELYHWIEKYQHGLNLCEICEGICAGYDCKVCPIEELK